MSLLNTFANNILPILLISGTGFALGKFLNTDPRPLGRVIFYVFTPLLVFNLLTTTDLPLDKIFLMMGFAAASILTIGGLAFLIGKLVRLDRITLTAVVITTLFSNAGNYGMPLVSFAFGQEALAYAGIYFAASLVLTYSLGVVIASIGHLDIKAALLGLLKVPANYAILLAILFIRTGWKLPEPLQRTVSLGASGAIPGMLVLLGLELQRARWNSKLGIATIPAICRLVIGPLIGLGMAALFGLQGVARQAGITETGTPSAVMNTVLATEYNIDPTLVTTIIFFTTILSPLTLTPVLYFLGK